MALRKEKSQMKLNSEEYSYEKCVSKVADFKQSSLGALSNNQKRVLYCECELMKLYLAKAKRASKSGHNFEKVDDLFESLTLIETNLELHGSERFSGSIISKIDQLVRILAVWQYLIICAIFFAIPCILVRPIDYFLVRLCGLNHRYQFSNMAKCAMAWTILKLSGIHLVVEGLDNYCFGKECGLVFFSHSSSLDAFILAASIPVKQYALGKADLFLIPFFSWLAIAFGGIPINRDNRNQAIHAIGRAAVAAHAGDCIAMSPEGTRSKSGQLLEFKKGPFYLWEQTHAPIIPLIIYGAFDLYPPSAVMNCTGKVYSQFLKPILPEEATSREEMSDLLRLRMLEALRDGPSDAGCELTFAQKVQNNGVLLLFYASVYSILTRFPYQMVFPDDTTVLYGVVLFLLWSVGVTLVLYVLTVYVIPRLYGSAASSGSASSSNKGLSAAKASASSGRLSPANEDTVLLSSSHSPKSPKSTRNSKNNENPDEEEEELLIDEFAPKLPRMPEVPLTAMATRLLSVTTGNPSKKQNGSENKNKLDVDDEEQQLLKKEGYGSC